MDENMSPEELKEEVNSISKTSLYSASIRAVIYMVMVYIIIDFFPSATWLWLVLGAYLIFDISLVVYVKYTAYKFNKNMFNETENS